MDGSTQRDIRPAGDAGRGNDGASAHPVVEISDRLRYKTIWRIRRFASDEDRRANRTYTDEEALRLFGAVQTTEVQGNLLLNEGINELWSLVCGTGGVKFDNTNAYLGVGDSSTAASASQTGLQASTNKLYKAMDTSYPTYGTSQLATWKSTFGSSEANFAWNEFTVANGNSDSADNLNRVVSSQGTKVAGQTWELTLQITLS
jgi:hypothetical protein